MKDIILTARRQKTELYTLLACFVIANLVNLYAIISHDAPMTELVTSLFYILTFTLVIYVAWTALRLVAYAIKLLTGKKNKK